MGNDIDFHSRRALAELELASASRDPEAARAHLARSSMHLESLRHGLELGAGRGHCPGGSDRR